MSVTTGLQCHVRGHDAYWPVAWPGLSKDQKAQNNPKINSEIIYDCKVLKAYFASFGQTLD
jgi:hypothetical protein